MASKGPKPVPLSTSGSCCGHNFNMHQGRMEGACVVCSCVGFEPDTEVEMGDSYAPAENTSARDSQVGGEHYKKYKIQPWDIIDEYGLGFYAGSALKYLLRHKTDRLEDLKKARHYLDKLIEIEEGGRGRS